MLLGQDGPFFTKEGKKLLFFALLFFVMEEGSQGSAMYFNGALGTKLLTAEATDASVALDPCFSVFDHDGLGGTDVAANTATHTHALFYYGLGTQDALGYAAEKALEGIFAVARKAERAALHYSLKIRNHQRG